MTRWRARPSAAAVSRWWRWAAVSAFMSARGRTVSSAAWRAWTRARARTLFLGFFLMGFFFGLGFFYWTGWISRIARLLVRLTCIVLLEFQHDLGKCCSKVNGAKEKKKLSSCPSTLMSIFQWRLLHVTWCCQVCHAIHWIPLQCYQPCQGLQIYQTPRQVLVFSSILTARWILKELHYWINNRMRRRVHHH